jgi:glycosyltransferase involved in cell wall biosynthesis
MIKKMFGAAIIAKNEAKNIEKCINYVKNICSQIVVVDTGSEDETPIISAKLGTEIYFHKWQNDFSEARNFAIKNLKTDWIISIDADEEIVLESFFSEINKIFFSEKFEKEKLNKIGGISIILNNFLDEKLQLSKKHRFTRIFRNDKNIFFEGKIHEQTANSIINSGFEIIESEIIFNHFGYIGQNSEKKLRNKKLLESSINENIQQNTEDDFLIFHLANTEFSMQNFEKSLNLFTKIKNSNQLSNLQKEEIKLKIAQIFLHKNEFENAINEINFKSQDIDNEGFRLNILGVANLSLHNFSEAKKIYNSPEIYLSKLVDKTILENVNKILRSI